MEIERKFLLNKLPDLPYYEHSHVEQGYFSIDPEVRIREKRVLPNGAVDFKLTLKGDGTLSRFESESLITPSFYNEVKEFIGKPFIHKDYYKYFGADNLTYEFSVVDNGAFIYAEVEFRNEEEANAFEWPFKECLIEEKTYDEAFKMKNYWLSSRIWNP